MTHYTSGELYPLYGDAAGTQKPVLAESEEPVPDWRTTGWWADYGGRNPNPSIWPRSDPTQQARHVTTEVHYSNQPMDMTTMGIAAVTALMFLKS